MSTTGITVAAVALIVPLVLTWLLKSRTAATVGVDGTVVLSYPRAWRGFVYFFALIPPAIAGLALFAPPKPDEAWIPGALAVGFAALIGPLGWEVFRYRLEVGANRIVCFSPWRGRLELRWGDVLSLTFNAAAMWYVIRGRGGITIRVSHYVSGINELLATASQRGVNPAGRLPAR